MPNKHPQRLSFWFHVKKRGTGGSPSAPDGRFGATWFLRCQTLVPPEEGVQSGRRLSSAVLWCLGDSSHWLAIQLIIGWQSCMWLRIDHLGIRWGLFKRRSCNFCGDHQCELSLLLSITYMFIRFLWKGASRMYVLGKYFVKRSLLFWATKRIHYITVKEFTLIHCCAWNFLSLMVSLSLHWWHISDEFC